PAPPRDQGEGWETRSDFDLEGDGQDLGAFDRSSVDGGRPEAPAGERVPLGASPEGVAGRFQPLDSLDPAVSTNRHPEPHPTVTLSTLFRRGIRRLLVGGKARVEPRLDPQRRQSRGFRAGSG